MLENIKTGTGGAVAILASLIPHLQQVNVYLQTLSFVIGITIGTITLYRIIDKAFDKWTKI